MAPFLLDTAGNALDLYDAIVWFDDAMHYLTWIPWVTAFGLLIVNYAPPIPPWAVFGVVLGFGAVHAHPVGDRRVLHVHQGRAGGGHRVPGYAR